MTALIVKETTSPIFFFFSQEIFEGKGEKMLGVHLVERVDRVSGGQGVGIKG